MIRELFLGLIRVHILYHAPLNPVYGLELMQELKNHGYHASPGTIYPILNKLEQDGLLTSEKVNVNEKKRNTIKLLLLAAKY